MLLEAGSSLGPFRIVCLMGRGGMAAVYKAYEPELDRHVALKVLPTAFLHDREFAKRFEREAKVIAKLEHPHIVPIHRFGIDSDIPWMSMRLLRIETLADLLEKGRVGSHRMIAVLSQVAEALDYAHRRGVVHRDVKPGNILFDAEECAYVGDFGIARIAEASIVLTQTGTITGTPQYMSPEQALGKRVDHRTDVYALGVIAYEMVTGRIPFAADNVMALLMQHAREPVPVPAPSEASASVVDAILRCLEKDPARRWSSASAFVNALADGFAASAADETVLITRPATPGESPADAETALRGRPATAPELPSAVAVDDGAPAIVFESVSRSEGGVGPTGVVRAAIGLGAVAVAALAVLTLVMREDAVLEPAAGIAAEDVAPQLLAPPVPVTDSPTAASQADRPTSPATGPADASSPTVATTRTSPDVPARRVADPAAAPVTELDRIAEQARSSFERGDLASALDTIESGFNLRGDHGGLGQLLADVERETRRRATDVLDASVGSIETPGEGLFDDGYVRFGQGHAFGEDDRLLEAARAFLSAEELFGAAVRASASVEHGGGAGRRTSLSRGEGESGVLDGVDAAAGASNDRQGIEDAVRRYARAYERESTATLKAVFPSLTPEELDSIDRSFLDWESVTMDLGIEQISIDGSRAEVWMTQRQTIVPNEGQVRRTESGLVLLLARTGLGDGVEWHITDVRQTR